MRTRTPEAPLRRYWAGFAALVAVILPAALLLRPGQIIDDGRTALLVDPGGAIASGLRIWDPGHDLGTVAAGDVRRLWPLAAHHWAMDGIGVPDWVAQRIWLAALLLAAAGGILAIARAWRWRPAAALAAAAAYALSPVATAGVLDAQALLPFAGLPWLLALTIQALRHRGWRHPVAFAVVLAAAGSSNGTAALLLLAVPLAWVGHAVFISQEVTRPRAISALVKVGLAVTVLNAWWVIALSVRATNGVDAARFGTPADVVAAASSAGEVIRGLGRWTAYRTASGEVTEPYTQQPMLLLASFLLPAAALLALGVSRWRHRPYVVGLTVVGVVVAAAAYDGGPAAPLPALVGALGSTGVGLALGLEGAVVVVALGLALGIGSIVAAAGEQSVRRATGAAVVVIAVSAATLPVLWTGSPIPASALRDEVVPDDTARLAAHLDATGRASRVLELPGVPGIGPEGASPLQAVLERPHVVRRVRPAGSAAGTDLLRAIDVRVQRGTLAPEALAPLARLLGVGDVVIRAGDAPEAAALLAAAPGFGPLERFGDLVTAPVTEPVDIVRAHAGSPVVFLSGSGDGIVDAAAAGLLRGDELVRYSSSVTDDADFVRTQLVDGRRLVITDTNRTRAERWTGLDGVSGFTETAQGGVLADDPFDEPLEVQGSRPGTRTVADPGPLTVQATSYGPLDRYRPDQRPALAADGDVGTAWALPADRAGGQELALAADDPLDGDLRIVQAAGDGGTAIDEVALRFDGGDAQVVDLTEASRTPEGQRIDVAGRRFTGLTIEIRSLTEPATEGDDVGLAEVDVGVRAAAWVRMPTDLLDAAGFRSTRYPLALVQTRLRAAVDAEDEERAILRIVELPTTRTYQLAGRARASAPGVVADAACRDDIVAVDGEPIPVRLVPTDLGDLRLEGCSPDGIVIAGGERRFSTAPAARTGVEVDQLVWTSEPVATAPMDLPAPAPALEVTDADATTLSLVVDGARSGRPFWIVFGQSHDDGWEPLEVDDAVEIDGPHLVNGYANGYLVTPADEQLSVELRFVPQNRVEVALLFSGLGALLAVGLALLRAQPIGAAPSHRQEPLRRLRAFTYEGALPTKREAVAVAAVGAVVGTFVAGPIVGVVLAGLGGFATRREGWRPAFTLLPALLLAGTATALVLAQVEERTPHTLAWPAGQRWAHTVTLTAVLLLGLDVVIDRTWRRGSLLE